jgi:hypothetical protein
LLTVRDYLSMPHRLTKLCESVSNQWLNTRVSELALSKHSASKGVLPVLPAFERLPAVVVLTKAGCCRGSSCRRNQCQIIGYENSVFLRVLRVKNYAENSRFRLLSWALRQRSREEAYLSSQNN